jgi:hypothetical protein
MATYASASVLGCLKVCLLGRLIDWQVRIRGGINTIKNMDLKIKNGFSRSAQLRNSCDVQYRKYCISERIILVAVKRYVLWKAYTVLAKCVV